MTQPLSVSMTTYSRDNQTNKMSLIILKRYVAESCLVIREGAAEGGANDWGEVVTR